MYIVWNRRYKISENLRLLLEASKQQLAQVKEIADDRVACVFFVVFFCHRISMSDFFLNCFERRKSKQNIILLRYKDTTHKLF